MVAPIWVNRDYLTTIDMPSAFWQLSVSSQHTDKSLTLNSYMSLFNLKLCTKFGQQISILDLPLTLDFLVHLGLYFHPMGEFGGERVGGRLGLRHFLSRTET